MKSIRWFVVGLVLLGLISAGVWAKAPKHERSRPEDVMYGPGSSYIEIAIDTDNGQYTMGVPNGPIILFGHPDPWSTFSSIRIDGADYTNDEQAFGNEIQAPLTSGNTNEGIWQLGNTPLHVHQFFTLVQGSNTGHMDTYLIQYKVDNLDSVTHSIGCRIMLDTDLDNNDGAPFRVPGTGSVTTEMEWDGGSIPPYFFVFNDLSNPSVTAQASVRGGQVVPTPGRLQIAAWPGIYNTDFDYTVTAGDPVTYDSAYATYWENYSLAPGQSITFSTYYGLGGIAVDTLPPLVSSLTAPVELDCQSNILTPNPFDIALYVANSSPGVTVTVTGIHAQLNLPAGLTLLSGNANQSIPDLAPTADDLLSWTVAADGTHTGSLAYSIQLSSSNVGTKTLTAATNVPSGCTACFVSLTASASPTSGTKPLNVSFTAQGTHPDNCPGSVTYDWNFGDGSAHSSAQNPTHTYTTGNTYTWTATATLGSAVSVKSGTIVVSNAPPPVVNLMKKQGGPFRFIVTGSNLQNGIAVAINGVSWPSVQWKNTGKIIIGGGASLKAVAPKGVPTSFTFTNPDGGSATLTWSW